MRRDFLRLKVTNSNTKAAVLPIWKRNAPPGASVCQALELYGKHNGLLQLQSTSLDGDCRRTDKELNHAGSYGLAVPQDKQPVTQLRSACKVYRPVNSTNFFNF